MRHALGALRYGPNPAGTVYDSIGDDFFLAIAPGWLNLGLWDGDGTDPEEALVAPRRLVEHVANALPAGGDVLDVGNGLAAQDPVIADLRRPRSLVALNITLSQLLAGRARLAQARASAANGDACRMPFAAGSFDSLICVEAAFHFRTRAAFLAEAYRVLRPSGVLAMSDVPVERWPRRAGEAIAGATQLRLWGLRRSAAVSSSAIEDLVRAAGFVDVRTELAGERVIAPALRFARARLDRLHGELPPGYEFLCRALVGQVELLWERGLLEYLFLTATRPDQPAVSRRSDGNGS